MGKWDLVIKKENAALRCEICHQEDMFNVETQICSRCFEYSSPRVSPYSGRVFTNIERRRVFENLNRAYQNDMEMQRNKRSNVTSVLLAVFKGLLALVLSFVLCIVLAYGGVCLFTAVMYFFVGLFR